MKSSASMERKTFNVGHACYQVGRLTWTPLPFQPKKSLQIPSRRYLHSAVAFEGRLYVLGGTDNESPVRENKMHILDLGALKWTSIEGRGFTEGRNGHACALFRDELYFFGGCQAQATPTSDFFKFTPALSSWTLLEQDDPPPERELALLAAPTHDYLLLLGGIDLLEDRIHEDAYVFRGDRWNRLNITHPPSPRVKMAWALCGSKLLTFGGEGPGDPHPQLFDQLHELTVDLHRAEIQFREIVPQAGRSPAARSAHGMAGLSGQLLLVYGGEGGGERGSALGDIWIFDLREREWAQIETIYGSMIPRYEFTLCAHGHELFLFGGFGNFSEQHAVIDELAKLEFLPAAPRHPDVCDTCEREHELRQIIRHAASSRQVTISTGFLYNLAQEIAFPFRAVELIVDAADSMHVQALRFSAHKTVEDYDYFVFEMEGGRGLSAASVLGVAEGEPPEGRDPREEKEERQAREEWVVAQRLRVGGLRLGKTLLYVSASALQRRVMMVSVDSKFAPNFEDSLAQFAYVQNLQTGLVLPSNGAADRAIITNVLRSQIQQPEEVLSRRQGQCLMVFQVNVLPTVEKAFYYELIFYNSPDSDVKIYTNERRAELLEQLGYRLGESPEFSLRAYLQLCHQKRRVQVRLNNDVQAVATSSYLGYLEEQAEGGVVVRREVGVRHRAVESCRVYEVVEGEWLERNEGILVYSGNCLVDRFDCPLGHLLSQKFYKKKYRTRNNLFQFVGVLQLKADLALNFTRTHFRKAQIYRQVIEELTRRLHALSAPSSTSETLSQLYDLKFSLARQPSKKQKRQPQ